jgi:catechol 2,3-dioxygenase-like lactoylglutathione lyase family enzyme
MAGPEHFPHPTHGFVVRRCARARAEFLTPPVPRETEIRCYIRDPDGYLIEVAQTTTTP